MRRSIWIPTILLLPHCGLTKPVETVEVEFQDHAEENGIRLIDLSGVYKLTSVMEHDGGCDENALETSPTNDAGYMAIKSQSGSVQNALDLFQCMTENDCRSRLENLESTPDMILSESNAPNNYAGSEFKKVRSVRDSSVAPCNTTTSLPSRITSKSPPAGGRKTSTSPSSVQSSV